MSIWEVEERHETIEGLDEHGRPDPAYAAALGLVDAPLGRRAGAFAIDASLYLVLQVPYLVFSLPLVWRFARGRISGYGFVNHPDFILAIVMAGLTTLLTLAFCITQLSLHGRRGNTLGKQLTGIRSVNVKTLARPGIGRVLLRALVVWGSAVVVVGPLAFLLSPLFDKQHRGRGWHDRVGETWLVDVRNGLQPYDEKRMRIARKTVTAAPVQQAKPLPSLATSATRDDQGEYRPGARVSAGVLGVARPHSSGNRPVVGLAGQEPEGAPPANPSDAAPGRPVMGGYLSTPAAAPAGAPAAPPPPPTPRAPGAPLGPPPPPAGAVPPAPGAAPAPPPAPTPVPAPMPASVPAAAPEPLAGFVLQLDTGQRVEVSEPVVLGRDPADVGGARRVPVADDTFSVSKTHLLLRPAGHGVELVDQNSTNGTEVVHDGVERVLEPGQASVAVPGDTIRIGDRSAVLARA